MARGPRGPVAGGGVLGIDEAGRGSVFGPLVVGGFHIEESELPRLSELGVRDSKLLTARRREELDREIRAFGRAFVRPIPPVRIDGSVRRGELNALEAATFAEIIRSALPKIAYVDACDPVEERFGRTVARLASVPASRVVARHHADRDRPVVGAASIVAKVARDRALAGLARRAGRALGSGYPSDPATRACLAAMLRESSALPSWVRSSWATVRNLMPTAEARPLESYR